MTWRQLTANRIALTRFLCGLGERFAATGLYQNAVAISGHRFVPTRFKVLRPDGNWAIHYCPCGQIALENSGGIAALNDQAVERTRTLQVLCEPPSETLGFGLNN
jgi:hypothetical protein